MASDYSKITGQQEVSEDDFLQGLQQIVDHLSRQADNQRKQSEPWKDLWQASEKGLYATLRKAGDQMLSIGLTASDVIKERFGIPKLSEKMWWLILAMPYATKGLRNYIQKQEGPSCCVDKTWHLYEQAMVAEINKLRAREGTNGLQDSVS
jgi:hypothetical protein